MMLGIGLRWWDMINVLGPRGVLVTMVYFQAIYALLLLNFDQTSVIEGVPTKVLRDTGGKLNSNASVECK